MQRLPGTALAIALALAFPAAAQADAVDDAIAALNGIQQNNIQTETAPAPPASDTESDTDYTLSCVEDFGPNGCPPSGLYNGKRPRARLGIGEAKASLRRLYVTDMNADGLPVRITACRNTARDRVACVLVMRLPGSVCKSRAHVVETTGDYVATVNGFHCRKGR